MFLISTHLNEAGHRRVEAIFQRLVSSRDKKGTRGNVEEFVKQFLFVQRICWFCRRISVVTFGYRRQKGRERMNGDGVGSLVRWMGSVKGSGE